MTDPLATVLESVLAAFDKLAIDYYIGGSVASMIHGDYRQTNDVDVVADLRVEHIVPLMGELANVFLVSETAIRDALRYRRSFNLIHLSELFKVDVFPLKTRPYDRMAMQRRQLEFVDCEPVVAAYLAAPEDILLAKLEWYRAGGEISDRQWRDIKGICKVQGNDLDLDYLQSWAKEIAVDDLLTRALSETDRNKESK